MKASYTSSLSQTTLLLHFNKKGSGNNIPLCLRCLVFPGSREGETETVKQVRANVCRRQEDIQTQPGFLSWDPWKLSPTILFLFVFFFLPFGSLASSERQQTAGLPSALSAGLPAALSQDTSPSWPAWGSITGPQRGARKTEPSLAVPAARFVSKEMLPWARRQGHVPLSPGVIASYPALLGEFARLQLLPSAKSGLLP